MQLMPATASRFGLANPYEPDASIHVASRMKYLAGKNWRLIRFSPPTMPGEGTVLAYLHGRKPTQAADKCVGRRTWEAPLSRNDELCRRA